MTKSLQKGLQRGVTGTPGPPGYALDYLQWSNFAYLTVSCVEYIRHLERVICPPEEGSEEKPHIGGEQLRQLTGRNAGRPYATESKQWMPRI